ncbi:MAG TPA: hypothetical protein VFX37_06680 [Pseudolabrys sp.]|nr:hypothetical protein [Pseudolabrys sp.]
MADTQHALATKSPPSRKARPAVRWGVAALIALSAAVLTAETREGGRRLEIALAGAHDPARFLTPVTQHVSASAVEMARLSTAVRELSADRDRLKARVASLQRTLEETTGSITRQVKEVAAATETAAKRQAAMSTALTLPSHIEKTLEPTNSANSAPVPLISVPKFSLAAAPPYGSASSQWSNEFVVPSRRQPASAQHVANVSAHSEVKQKEARLAEQEDVPPMKKEFAIELGSGTNAAALWDQWISVKASYGPLFTGLEPRYRRHRHGSGAADYQLIAGPLADAAAANRLCSILATVHVDCQTTTFDGAHLTVQ